MTVIDHYLTNRLGHQTDSQQSILWFQRLVALFGLILFAVTWRLWTPQTVFPQVPLLPIHLPAIVHWLCLAGVFVSLLILGAMGHLKPFYQPALTIFLASLLMLIILDQQRLQAWAYELILIMMILLLCPKNKTLVYLRLLLISVYAYSALMKFDYLFLHTVGQRLLSTTLGFVGIEATDLSEQSRVALVAIFPIGELLIAVLLCVRRCWKYGAVLAIGMHLLLLLILGPWGLSHKMGVWIWNLFFIGKIGLLFGLPQSVANQQVKADDQQHFTSFKPISSLAVQLIMLIALVMPLFTSWGWWDHWLSWGLYCPNHSQVVLLIHQNAKHRLPKSLQPYLDQQGEEGWSQLYLDRWCLEVLEVPIYPQSRVQLGVAKAIADLPEMQNRVRLILQDPPNRMTGKRVTTQYTGWLEIDRATNHFWLNARANSAFKNE